MFLIAVNLSTLTLSVFFVKTICLEQGRLPVVIYSDATYQKTKKSIDSELNKV